MFVNEHTKDIVLEGMESARSTYPAGSEVLKGALSGYEACLNATSGELVALLDDARDVLWTLKLEKSDEVPFYQAFKDAVEWVCNVSSAVVVLKGRRQFYPSDLKGKQRAKELIEAEVDQPLVF